MVITFDINRSELTLSPKSTQKAHPKTPRNTSYLKALNGLTKFHERYIRICIILQMDGWPPSQTENPPCSGEMSTLTKAQTYATHKIDGIYNGVSCSNHTFHSGSLTMGHRGPDVR